MTWRVMDGHLVVAKRERLRQIVIVVDRWQRLAMQAEERRLLRRCIVEKLIVSMKIHGDAKGALCTADSCHVIDVGMGQQNADHRQLFATHDIQEHVDLVARIDHQCLTRSLAAR